MTRNAAKACLASGLAVVRRDSPASPFARSASRFAARPACHSSHVIRMTGRSSTGNLPAKVP